MNNRVLVISLIVSVSLSLLIIAFAAGCIISGTAGGPPHQFGWIMQHLDDQSREVLKPIIREHAAQMRPARRELRESQRKFNRLLKQEDLSREELAEVTEALKAASTNLQGIMYDQMLAALPKLSREERLKVLHYLRHRSGEPRRRPRGGIQENLPIENPTRMPVEEDTDKEQQNQT